MNQARSIRWNVSAGASRPNPQRSFKYGEIAVTDIYVILDRPAELIDGKWRTTLNGISYIPPSTPLKLAQQFNISGVYKFDFPNKLMNRPAKVDTSLINGTFNGFMESSFRTMTPLFRITIWMAMHFSLSGDLFSFEIIIFKLKKDGFSFFLNISFHYSFSFTSFVTGFANISF
ncbi:hypothetical protein ACFX13_037875 [Malus domestica]